MQEKSASIRLIQLHNNMSTEEINQSYPSYIFDYFLDGILWCFHLLCLVIIIPIFLIASPFIYLAFTCIPGYRKTSSRKPIPPQKYNLSTATYKTLYFTTSDHTRLAVDVWLPSSNPNTAFPTMVNGARYWRSAKLHFPWNIFTVFGGKPLSFVEFDFINGYLAEGFAVVIFDVRGSGASTGKHMYPWHDRDQLDYDEMITWVQSQSFCNGKLGLWGTSYSAVNSCLAGCRAASPNVPNLPNDQNLTIDINYHQQRSIQAVGSLFGFWDIYRDIAYIGGVRLEVFLQTWQRFLRGLDLAELWRISWFLLLIVENVSDVPPIQSIDGVEGEGRGGSVRRSRRQNYRLIKQHHSMNWLPTEDSVECSDDPSSTSHEIPDQISPQCLIKTLVAQSTFTSTLLPDFLHVGGWYDSSTLSVLKYFNYLKTINAQQIVIIGPWTHAGIQHVRPFELFPVTFAAFSFPELLRSFMSSRLKLPHEDDGILPLTANTTATTSAAAASSIIADSVDTTDIAIDIGSDVDTSNEIQHKNVHTLPCDTSPSALLSFLNPSTPFAYYIMQAEVWCISPCFPPLNATPFILSLSSTTDVNQTHSKSFIRCNGFRPHLTLEQGENCSDNKMLTLHVNPTSDQGSVGSSRWLALGDVVQAVSADFDHPSLNHLRYTSSALDEDTEVTGFGKVGLKLSTNESNADVFVCLQCIDMNGRGSYVTEGFLRLKHRKVMTNQSDDDTISLVLPDRSFKHDDLLGPPVTPELIWIPLLPTSFMFKRGQRIRLSVYGADIHNFASAALSPFDMNLWMGESKLVLPVVR